ncbi:histone deacetylase [uncultured Paludibaculum sp.]|uniref:histone deacetylase family protein n=1 Tax=uncultured Paludibaculum sp. TaxID=1765020 RepID=UPI002AAC2604|nr:histone deacetylase [uncultured Paludibaculum sp.]
MPLQRQGETAPTGLVLDSAFLLHDPGPGHSESPDRYRAVRKALSHDALAGHLTHLTARAATEEDLHLCHSRPYLATVRHDIARRSPALSTGDTGLCEKSLDVALLAAGAAFTAVDAVMLGQVSNAFAAVRPPGHHATATRGMGFCIFNNVALAARHARKVHGVDRVLIVDWDVHHGNGTQDIFYEDSGVFFFSTHQSPWYPGTGSADEIGAGSGKGTTMNCPFHAGAGHAEIIGAFRRKLLPAMMSYKPDLVIISAGFDSRKGDPLGRFLLKDEDFRELTHIVMEIADHSAHGRVVSLLEGGYSLAGLAAGVTAHIEALLGLS